MSDISGARSQSPVADLLGYEPLSADATAAAVEVAFQAAAHLFNPTRVMQGGMTMAMLEMAMTDAVLAHGKGAAATVTLLEVQCNYLAAVGPGPVRCRAQLIRQGRSTVFVMAELFNAAGELAATASAVASHSADNGEGA